MEKTDAQWQTCLTPEQFAILRKKGTEKPFTGKYYNHHATGTYICTACKNELFSSEKKFDSGTGWPSFFAPVSPTSIDMRPDNTLFMHRTEVLCGKCKGHLGHVFTDGPKPTGLRFCINSAALDFQEKKITKAKSTKKQTPKRSKT